MSHPHSHPVVPIPLKPTTPSAFHRIDPQQLFAFHPVVFPCSFPGCQVAFASDAERYAHEVQHFTPVYGYFPYPWGLTRFDLMHNRAFRNLESVQQMDPVTSSSAPGPPQGEVGATRTNEANPEEEITKPVEGTPTAVKEPALAKETSKPQAPSAVFERPKTRQSSLIELAAGADANLVKVQEGKPTRPRRPPEEVVRLYHCDFPDCDKSYGTLSHLNTHIRLQRHGKMKSPAEFGSFRRELRLQRKLEKQKKGKVSRKVPLKAPLVFVDHSESNKKKARGSKVESGEDGNVSGTSSLSPAKSEEEIEEAEAGEEEVEAGEEEAEAGEDEGEDVEEAEAGGEGKGEASKIKITFSGLPHLPKLPLQ